MAGIDLNADLGEGFGVWRLGDDDAMLGSSPAPTSRAVSTRAIRPACCGCAGSAAERGVRIGAQVSYRDLAGFGRRFIDVAAEDLVADVVYQIGALQAIAAASGSAVSYVKPHGALYNTIVTNREQAAAVAEAVRLVDATLPVLGMAGSAFFDEAARARSAHGGRGIRRSRLPAGRPAGFPSRTGRGVARSRRRSRERVVTMVTSGQVTAIDGTQIAVSVESVCVHGDSPGAVQIAAAVRDRLEAAGVEIRAFC